MANNKNKTLSKMIKKKRIIVVNTQLMGKSQKQVTGRKAFIRKATLNPPIPITGIRFFIP
jgi:hypothetical protein